MNEPKSHWTNRSAEDFVHRIGFDFIAQLEDYLEADGMSPDKFAVALGVGKSRVSQILNNPGNLRLLTIVQCVKAIGRKVAIVAYDDGDRANSNGPVNSGIFEKCWSNHGKPNEFSAIGTWIDTRLSTDVYKNPDASGDWQGEESSASSGRT